MPFWSSQKGEVQANTDPSPLDKKPAERPASNNLGLRLVTDGEESVVDIVFVHGLTGDRESTWTEKASKVFWPGELLPESIPEARIITFGYDADVTHFWAQPSHNRVVNHATNLVQQLGIMRRRSRTANRPIIFVAHSLGGLVCEDALLVSQMSAENHIKKIAECTRAFAFMGTPHHGSDLAKWGAALAGFTSLVKHANRKIVQVLEPDSETLARIQQDFHSTVRNRGKKVGGNPIQITCFFEELEVRGVGMIVPSHSAILPGYTPISIHADHMGMTKFSTSTSNDFQKIANEIWVWVDDLKTEAEEEDASKNAPDAPSALTPPPQPYSNPSWSQGGWQEFNSISGNISGQNLIVGNHVNQGDRFAWEKLSGFQQPNLSRQNPRQTS